MKKVIFIALLYLFSSPLFSHPGLVDETGGHVDHETKAYHYHGEASFDTPHVENTHDHVYVETMTVSLLLIVLFLLLIFYKKKRKINQ